MPSSKISDQRDVAVESERVTLRRTDHAPALGPVDKGVVAAGHGYHRLQTAFRKFATAADGAISTGRRPHRDLVLLKGTSKNGHRSSGTPDLRANDSVLCYLSPPHHSGAAVLLR
jgi:hypothetical protein